eukprot:1239511-Rhodomonas_salina.2
MLFRTLYVRNQLLSALSKPLSRTYSCDVSVPRAQWFSVRDLSCPDNGFGEGMRLRPVPRTGSLPPVCKKPQYGTISKVPFSLIEGN